MITDFTIVGGETVPETYTWDIGNPLETTPTTTAAFNTVVDVSGTLVPYISGYAPGLKVVFDPFVADLPYTEFANTSATYIWNFGDYYNSETNTQINTCLAQAEHIYMMPGKYRVSFTNIQTKENQPTETGDDLCFGKHGIGWFWNNLERFVPGTLSALRTNRTTWDEAACDGPKNKWWDAESKCFGSYCKFWSWYALNKAEVGGLNPVTWTETLRDGPFFAFWTTGVNTLVCELFEKRTLDVTEQTIVKDAIVEVVEKLPVASIQVVTSLLTGTSPFSTQLSPKFIKLGSFPIDKIIWNPGDGTPDITITRYSVPDPNYFVYTNTYFSDPQDPRNYDFVYTYKRNINDYPIFYPSLTCYNAATNSSDSCSVAIGPIELEPIKNDIELLKVKKTTEGNVYGIELDDNISFLTNKPDSNSVIQTTNTPSSPIRKIQTGSIIYFGNTGENYPPVYTPSCPYVPSEPELEYLTLEENDIAITLEDETLLYK